MGIIGRFESRNSHILSRVRSQELGRKTKGKEGMRVSLEPRDQEKIPMKKKSESGQKLTVKLSEGAEG